jgi:predicted nucleotidyltransferase
METVRPCVYSPSELSPGRRRIARTCRTMQTSDMHANEPIPASQATAALQRRLAEALAPRSEVLEAYLFGSQALGPAQPHSDIDVAVYVDPRALAAPYEYGYAAELTAHLMQRLGTNAIDLVVLNQAPPLVYHRVLRDGHRVLSRDLRATTTREGYALSRYWDYVPALAKVEAARRALRTSTS